MTTVMATADTKTYTPEDLLNLPDEGAGYELIDGNLVELNVSVLSSRVGGSVFFLMYDFCKKTNAGLVFPSDMGLQCFSDAPGKVRKADASFVRRDRLAEISDDDGFLLIPPNLVVEVVAPDDLFYELDVKVQEFLKAGVELVWIINPMSRTALIHRANGTISVLTENDDLDGETVLPGFRCRLRELFPHDTAELPAKP